MNIVSRTVIVVLLMQAFTAAFACQECVQETLGIQWTPATLAQTSRGVRVRIRRIEPPFDVADIALAGDEQRFTRPSDAIAARTRLPLRAIEATACRKRVPYHALDAKTAIALRPHLRVGNSIEENVGPCVDVNGVLFFGLAFYEGEGMDGIGGIGRYDPATNKLEVRRPAWLRDKSVRALATDGHTLWFGAYQQYEKDEVPWGLVRYDWDRDELQPLAGDDAPCGLSVSDVLLDRGIVWVATDAALSRLDLHEGRWSHAALQRDGARFVPLNCHALYRRMVVAELEHVNDKACTSLCESEEQIADAIARVDPGAVREVVFSRKPLPKHFAEMETIGTVARNFAELKRYAIDRVSDPATLQHALDRFARKKPSERAWRDFALAWARKSGNIDQLAYLRGDAAVFDYLAAVARPDDRRSVDAVRMLPWIDSRRAIPILLGIVTALSERTRDFDETMKYEDALLALEHAAHLRIEADGSRTPLAANSDTPEYDEEEYGRFVRNARTDEAAMKAIVGQWRQWAKEHGMTPES